MSTIQSNEKGWVTSKEVLLKTGISRATLNNYIKMEIIPKPVVTKPKTSMKGTRRIGYFPVSVLERIHMVNRLKREGNSMKMIADRLKDIPFDDHRKSASKSSRVIQLETSIADSTGLKTGGGPLRLTFEEIVAPAYLLNNDFEIMWVNKQAVQQIFGREAHKRVGTGRESIFRMLFNWELHNRIRNWRDLVAFHMSFVKIGHDRGWIEKVYEGISKNESLTLQRIYDRVSAFPKQNIKETPIQFFTNTGTTLSFRVYNLFFKEGILFLYTPLRRSNDKELTIRMGI